MSYQVEGKTTLTGNWSRILFDSRTQSPYMWEWDGHILSIRDPAAGPALTPAYFYRLHTILDD